MIIAASTNDSLEGAMQVLRLPSELENDFRGAWFLLHRFSRACGTDFTKVARDVICSQQDDMQCTAASAAEWILQDFVVLPETLNSNHAFTK